MKFFTRMKIRSLSKKAMALFKNRQNNAVSEADEKREIAIYLELAKLYDQSIYNKKIHNAKEYALECYRAAGSLNDINSQYIVAERLMENGKFWSKMKNSLFACSAHSNYAENAFKESFVYLQSAEEKGHPLAKRLHGLAYIHGWGVDIDEDKGFKLVVDSIEQENAWDRATEIFKELGLNKPEFFSSIMSMRKSQE